MTLMAVRLVTDRLRHNGGMDLGINVSAIAERLS